MPDLHIGSFARDFRTACGTRAPALIFLTSLGSRWRANPFEGIPNPGFLTKPVKGSQLPRALARALGFAAGGGGAETAGVGLASALERRGLRILLAEDHPINRRVALKMLESLGIHAVSVVNGREVLATLAREEFDLVLMDIQMPELDGFETARQIRDPASPVLNRHIPIIAITAHALKGDRERCLESGMNDFLPKPIRPPDLVRILRQWVGLAPAVAGRPDRGGPVEEGVVFDRAGFLQRLSGDETTLEEVISQFLEDAARKLAALRSALETDDRETAARLAHSLKGVARTIGANALGEAAARLDSCVRQPREGPWEEAFRKVEAEFARFRDALGHPSPEA